MHVTSLAAEDPGPPGEGRLEPVVKAVSPSAALKEGHLRSIVKAASWRVTGTVDTFILSYFFTGSVKLAGSIAFTEVATKLVLFYLHERAWNRISWGRSAAPRGTFAAGASGARAGT